AARQRLQEPDVRDRRGQLDVTHALTAHALQGNLDTALFANDVLVLHPLVLAAQAFVILDWSKDARAEQTVTLRFKRAVVDGFRLFDFAERPGADLLGRCDRNLDLIEHRRWRLVAEGVVDQVLVHSIHRLLPSVAPVCSQSPGANIQGRARAPLARGAGYSERLFGRLQLHDVQQLDVQAERPHFLDEDVEAFRNAGLERVVAARDRFVDLGASGDVVGLHRQHFLQGVRSAVSFERPHLHFAEALTAELRLAAQR